ncbi:MAG: Vitamin B12 dependent methionine synthase activation subunit [Clostridia bacterium]|nr:Vitamin B12 dependent methionine synthase activation subunit [Clostridia bacterium]
MIQLIHADGADLPLVQKEIFRYLGYGSQTPTDTEILKRTEECTETLRQALSCKACFDRFPLTFTENGVTVGDLHLPSMDLKRHLRGCGSAYLMTATLGYEVDRILGRYSLLSPVHAVIAQAVGAAAIEAFCDRLCRQFADIEQKKLRSRFSAGYGDLPLDTQPALLGLLDAYRKIGVTLTEGLMMIPTKSVSAIVGIEN